MKRYIRSSEDDMDYGYGFDSNGEPIDVSTVKELYRIAENEILPKSDLNKQFYGCSIDEDSFEYHNSGTAWGAYLRYTIYAPTNSDELNINDFLRADYDGMWMEFDGSRRRAEIDFIIHVDGDNVYAKRGEVSIYDPSYNTYMTQLYDEALDWERLCDYVAQAAESTVREIHSTLSNI